MVTTKVNGLLTATTLDEYIEILFRMYESEFDPSFFLLNEDQVRPAFQLSGGYWQHNGSPRAPHAVTRAGLHTDGFIAVPQALKHGRICDHFGRALANKIMDEYDLQELDWVIGSDHAAATFSYAVMVGMLEYFPDVSHDFPEKKHVVEGVPLDKWMSGHKGEVIAPDLKIEEIQYWARHKIKEGEVILPVEELCTTNLTQMRVRTGLSEAHPHPLKYAPVEAMLVNRTGSSDHNGVPIVSLLEVSFNEWDVPHGERCPLCEGGSVALENVKKTTATWERLMAGKE